MRLGYAQKLHFQMAKAVLCLVILISFFAATPAYAEGSIQTGLNQPIFDYNATSVLIATTQRPIYVILDNATDVINVSLCDASNVSFQVWNEAGTVEYYDSADFITTTSSTDTSGSSVGTSADICQLASNPTTTSLDPAPEFRWSPSDTGGPNASGTFQVRLFVDGNNIDFYDISVTANKATNPNPSALTGRVFSYSWAFDAGGYSVTTDANYFVLVPGGQVSSNYVWQLDFQDFGGFVYDVNANALGVTEDSSGDNIGFSVPFTGYSLAPLYPIYLGYPVNALPEPFLPPTISNYRFLDSDGIDQTISPGATTSVQDSGTFSFDSSIPGTAQLIIDTNQDGVFGNTVLGVDDVYLYSFVVAGSNSITWDGTGFDGNILPDGKYEAQLQVRIGEYHFVSGDAETSGGGISNTGASGAASDSDGLTIYRATSNSSLFGTPVFWDDLTGFDPDRVGNGGNNLPDGVTSVVGATTGAFRHTWGSFSSTSFGNEAYVDTYTYGLSSYATTPASIDSTGSDAPANIGLAKNASISGNEVTLDFYLENFSGINVSSLSLIDDLDSVLGAGNYTVDSIAPISVGTNSTINVNTGFTGSTGATNMLTGSNTLAAFETAQIRIVLTVTSTTDQGFGTGLYYNSATVSGAFTPSGGGASQTASDDSTNGTDPDSDNDGSPADNNDDTPIFLVNIDYGDAPDTAAGSSPNNYQTLLSDNGARHSVDSNLKLGNLIDGDVGDLQNANASADDTNTNDDEDSVTSIPQLPTTSSGYSLNVSVTNNTLNPAYLVGWIDLNKDGDFNDANEQSAVITVATSTVNGTKVLTWSGLTGHSVGTSFIRIRVTTDASFASSPSPVGAASDGEVEDYSMLIIDTSDSICPVGDVSHIYTSSDSPSIGPNGGTTTTSVISVPDIFSVTDINLLNINGMHSYMGDLDFFLDAPNGSSVQLYDQKCGANPNFNFILDDESANSYASIPCPPTSGTDYQPFASLSGLDNQNASGNWTLRIIDRFNGDGGTLNDWTLELCEAPSFIDYGDAPSTYGDASHTSTVGATYYLGSQAPDGESFSLNTTNGGTDGTGDDSDGSPDDEDGVTLSTSYSASSSDSVSISVVGSGGYLNAWFDWNADGDFDDSGEKVATNVQDNGFGDSSGVTGTITINLTVPSTTPSATSYARFRWSSVITNSTGLAADGEVEDYAVTLVGGADISVVKSVDTSAAAITAGDVLDADNSGNVTPGDTVTFTILVSNEEAVDVGTLVITDIVSAGYSYVASSISGGDSNDDSNPTGSGLTWTITALNAGDDVNLSFKALVLSSTTPSDYENTASITSSVTPDTNSSNDISTVTPDILRIIKYVCNESTQGDGTCDIGAVGASDPTDDFEFSVSGSPGDTLIYRIEYENFATEIVDFDFSDNVPVFTTLQSNSYSVTGEARVECHANGSVGSVDTDLGAVTTVAIDITSATVCNGSILPNERGAVMFKATVN